MDISDACDDGQCLYTYNNGLTICANMTSWTGKQDFKNCHKKCLPMEEKCDGKCDDNQCEDNNGSCRFAGKDASRNSKSCMVSNMGGVLKFKSDSALTIWLLFHNVYFLFF